MSDSMVGARIMKLAEPLILLGKMLKAILMPVITTSAPTIGKSMFKISKHALVGGGRTSKYLGRKKKKRKTRKRRRRKRRR